METENKTEKVLCSPRKWSSVLTDRNQIYVVSNACVENSRFEVSIIILERKLRYTRKGILFPQVK